MFTLRDRLQTCEVRVPAQNYRLDKNNDKRKNTMEFKMIEKQVFNAMCIAASKITAQILEEIDNTLMRQRDKKIFRSKGKKTTTIKTIYGNVEYRRQMYLDNNGNARYLLDEYMNTKENGMYSVNLIEKVVKAATEESYRKAAEQLNDTTGNNISHTAVWNIVNTLGNKISENENNRTSEEYSPDKKDTEVIFEEMDGVWLPTQTKEHKADIKHELKVATIYEGWDAETGSHLINKQIVAGMEPAKTFIKKKDNAIKRTYNIDEIKYRILNGDGGNWIKDEADGVIFQLDRFHVLKEIRAKIKDKRAARDIASLYRNAEPDKMLDYIDTYANSIDTDDQEDKGAENARKLYQYLNNNYHGLIPYKKRINLPEAPEGIIYKDMGVQESQNCTVITLRMKHGRMRWSVNGANAMAKVLAAKNNGQLEAFIQGKFNKDEVPEISENLSAGKIPAVIARHKNIYAEILNGGLPILSTKNGVYTKLIRNLS